ncbi:hypothetical protein CYY_009581 [Polysphondylium violaceum]|uniref:Uncharacterized protein n=1 Tax=Polysphondylium violaceum TaxID=133409 RepID=A0A8J4PL92_9MYCE|nr:hypothetical protein CYY_009581 [Polysphondylium violaceum]
MLTRKEKLIIRYASNEGSLDFYKLLSLHPKTPPQQMKVQCDSLFSHYYLDKFDLPLPLDYSVKSNDSDDGDQDYELIYKNIKVEKTKEIYVRVKLGLYILTNPRLKLVYDSLVLHNTEDHKSNSDLGYLFIKSIVTLYLNTSICFTQCQPFTVPLSQQLFIPLSSFFKSIPLVICDTLASTFFNKLYHSKNSNNNRSSTFYSRLIYPIVSYPLNTLFTTIIMNPQKPHIQILGEIFDWNKNNNGQNILHSLSRPWHGFSFWLAGFVMSNLIINTMDYLQVKVIRKFYSRQLDSTLLKYLNYIFSLQIFKSLTISFLNNPLDVVYRQYQNTLLNSVGNTHHKKPINRLNFIKSIYYGQGYKKLMNGFIFKSLFSLMAKN